MIFSDCVNNIPLLYSDSLKHLPVYHYTCHNQLHHMLCLTYLHIRIQKALVTATRTKVAYLNASSSLILSRSHRNPITAHIASLAILLTTFLLQLVYWKTEIGAHMYINATTRDLTDTALINAHLNYYLPSAAASENVTGFLPQILRRSQRKIWPRISRVRVQTGWYVCLLLCCCCCYNHHQVN